MQMGRLFTASAALLLSARGATSNVAWVATLQGPASSGDSGQPDIEMSCPGGMVITGGSIVGTCCSKVCPLGDTVCRCDSCGGTRVTWSSHLVCQAGTLELEDSDSGVHGFSAFTEPYTDGSGGDALWTYVGCFRDNEGGRDMVGRSGSAGASVPVDAANGCAAICEGYNYFGLQWTNQCFCDNSYNNGYGNNGNQDNCPGGECPITDCDADGVLDDDGTASLCGNGQGNCGNRNAVYVTSGMPVNFTGTGIASRPHALNWDSNAAGQISDGGGDMYDTGNRIKTSLCSNQLAPYTDGMVPIPSECFGAGGTYMMDVRSSMMVLLANNSDSDTLTISISGDLGADGGGTRVALEFSSGPLRGFSTHVCGAGTDPTINHLFIVDASLSPGVSHQPGTGTLKDDDSVSGIGAGSRILYLLYSTTSNSVSSCHSDDEHQAVFAAAARALEVCDPRDVSACIADSLGLVVDAEVAGAPEGETAALSSILPLLPPHLFSTEFATPLEWWFLTFVSDRPGTIQVDSHSAVPFIGSAAHGVYKAIFQPQNRTQPGAAGVRITSSVPAWGMMQCAATNSQLLLYGDVSAATSGVVDGSFEGDAAVSAQQQIWSAIGWRVSRGSVELLPDASSSRRHRLQGSISQTGHLLVTPVLTWSAAEDYCVNQGGHLASIHSAEEDAEVRAFMQASTSTDYPWIGGYSTSTNTASTYEWSDDTPWDYTNPSWSRNDGHPNFVHYYRSGTWGTYTSTATQHGICRVRPSVRPLTGHTETGADGAEWSNTRVTNAGSAGKVHGPWGSDVRSVTRQIQIPPGSSATCQVSWRSWSIDSRDNEEDRVVIDGQRVWGQQAQHGCSAPWVRGPADFPQSWGTPSDICYIDTSVEVACTETMTVRFESDLDQSLSDEGWAFSDFSVTYGSPAEVDCWAQLASAHLSPINETSAW